MITSFGEEGEGRSFPQRPGNNLVDNFYLAKYKTIRVYK
jgi:hypothetical protein